MTKIVTRTDDVAGFFARAKDAARRADRGFAKARDRLAWGCLERLNTFVVQLAGSLGLIDCWQGLRVVAADASVLMLCTASRQRPQKRYIDHFRLPYSTILHRLAK